MAGQGTETEEKTVRGIQKRVASLSENNFIEQPYVLAGGDCLEGGGVREADSLERKLPAASTRI